MYLFAFTIALSAFLLFLVQPIVARQILPWFGGSAAVWTSCMMFFQLALLAGYAYSDAVVRRLSLRSQRRLHAVLLLASLACLPILIGEGWRPEDPGRPTLQIAVMLFATIGLPYFMLSTTGPLLQAWFNRRFPSARVYRLYALSNAASLAALLAYPPLIDPMSTVVQQSWGWSLAYLVFVASGLLLAWRAAKGEGGESFESTPVSPAGSADRSLTPASAPELRHMLAWLGLSALASLLLLAVTAHLTRNVASIPFLWLLPLTLYLLSFILCFDGRAGYRGWLWRPLAALACLAMTAGLFVHVDGASFALGGMPVIQGTFVYALGLFAACMMLHGELAHRRPPPTALTRFYLMIAIGGALGGIGAAVIAPAVFDGDHELPLGLTALAFVIVAVASTGRGRFIAFLVLVMALLGAGVQVWLLHAGAIAKARSFYGTLTVRDSTAGRPEDRLRLLAHGNTLHGSQSLDPGRRAEPTGYYTASSGVGQVLAWAQTDGPGAASGQRIGVVGLGAGVLATYRRPQDHYRFYEIDPLVATFARRHFDFLSAEPAGGVSVSIGDARLSLAAEPPNRYAVLAIDAFSSDAIPMHLLTVEAMALYRQHVHENGAIAFHISNRYLDLAPVVRHLADAIGWTAVLVADRIEAGRAGSATSSYWVIVTANEGLRELLTRAGGTEPAIRTGLRPWTDRYGNLFQVLRWRD